MRHRGRTRRAMLGALGAGLACGPAVSLASGRVAGPDERSVEVNVGYASARGRAAVRERATAVHHEFGFDALTASVPASAVESLAGRADLRYVERNGLIGGDVAPRRQPRVDPDDDEVSTYGRRLVNADAATESGVTGAGADVAVLDTGIDSTHPDVAANLGEGRAFVPGVADVAELGLPAGQDDDVLVSHGTHVAGVAGAVDNDVGVVGVSPDATLHAVKVLVGVLGGGTAGSVAAGVEFVADREWDVANLSLGGPERFDVVADAVRDARERGVLLVAAAGNAGMLPTDPPASAGETTVAYPAAYDDVLAVSATDSEDDVAAFSSVGPEVDLAAPGVDVLSTALPVNVFSTVDDPVRRYIELSGTSFAAPYVAGAGALLMADDGLSNEQARERLVETAADVGLSADQQGGGRLDVAAALDLD